MTVAQKNRQAAQAVLLIRPEHFGFNQETAATNVFQKNNTALRSGISDEKLSKKATREFDHFISLLIQEGIEVLVTGDKKEVLTPDSVFPNNWFSTHHDGTVILYPMLSQQRRKERRADIFESVLPTHPFFIKRIVDLTSFEVKGKFMEGTGSLVFDHPNKTAYANLSSRTNKELVNHVCGLLGYKPLLFTAKSTDGNEIYHTNVMLTIAEEFAVICEDSIPNKMEKENVLQKLAASSREIISISLNQMEQFAGNMLQVRNTKDEPVTLMSKAALESLNKNQHESILRYSRILAAPVPTIEAVGGGSVRCMMAEIFLPVSR